MFWVLLVVGLLGLGYGVLGVMAGAMSDAPQAGEDAANSGFIFGAIGLAVIILDFVARHYDWLPK